MDYTKTKENLSHLLQTLATTEKETELHRAVLSNKNSLNLASAFRYIDHNNKGKIKSGDIRLFLEENGVNLSNGEIQEIFNKIDKDNNGEIDWLEFQRFFLNTQFLDLPPRGTKPMLSKEVAKGLIDMMKCELNGEKELERLKDLLNRDPNFNPDDNFKSLDTFSKGFLDVRDIYDFLAQNTDNITYKKAERIMKRIDGNSSGRISLDKWRQLFGKKVLPTITRKPEVITKQPIRITAEPRVRKSVVVSQPVTVKNITIEVPSTENKPVVTTVKKTVVEENKTPVDNKGKDTVIVKKKKVTTTVKEIPPVTPVIQKEPPKKVVTTTTTTKIIPPSIEKPRRSVSRNSRGKRLLDKFLHTALQKGKPVQTTRSSVYNTKPKYTPEKKERNLDFKRRSPSQPSVPITRVIEEPVIPVVHHHHVLVPQGPPPPPIPPVSPVRVYHNHAIEKPPLAVSIIHQTPPPVKVETRSQIVERRPNYNQRAIEMSRSRSPPQRSIVMSKVQSPPQTRVNVNNHHHISFQRPIERSRSPPTQNIIRGVHRISFNSKSPPYQIERQQNFVENKNIVPSSYISKGNRINTLSKDEKDQNGYLTLGKKASLKRTVVNHCYSPEKRNSTLIRRSDVLQKSPSHPVNVIHDLTMELSPEFHLEKKLSEKQILRSPSAKNVLQDLKQNTMRDYHNKFDLNLLPPKGKSSSKKNSYQFKNHTPPYKTPEKRVEEPREIKMNIIQSRDYNKIYNYERPKKPSENLDTNFHKNKYSPSYKNSALFNKSSRKNSKEKSLRLSRYTKIETNGQEAIIEDYECEEEKDYKKTSYGYRNISKDKKITELKISHQDSQRSLSIESIEEITPKETRRVTIKREESLENLRKSFKRKKNDKKRRGFLNNYSENEVEEKAERKEEEEARTLIFDRNDPKFRSKIPDMFDKDDVEEISVTKTIYTPNGVMKKIVTTRKMPNGEVTITEKLVKPEKKERKSFEFEYVEYSENDCPRKKRKSLRWKEYEEQGKRAVEEYNKYGREFEDSVEKKRRWKREASRAEMIKRRRTYTTSSPGEFRYINPKLDYECDQYH